MEIVLKDKSPGWTHEKRCIHCVPDIIAGSLFFHFQRVILSGTTHQINVVNLR